MRLLLILLSFFPTLVLAQTEGPPNVIIEQRGNSTNYRAEGELASSQAIGCIGLAQAKNTYAPPDLYKSMAECILRDNNDFALELYTLANVYARFDAERVADKTAGQARTALMMKTFSGMPQEKRNKFSDTLASSEKNVELTAKLCTGIQLVGPPNYYPNYMILHGMGAFLGNPHSDALVKDFDSAAAWKKLQTAYLNCPS